MAIKAYSYAKDGKKALSKNFHVWEFQCKDHSDPIFVDDELVTLLQKILYLADYMEPNRDFPGVERLRALAQHDLDEAVLLGLEMSLDLLTETGQPIDVNSRAARDFLKSERTKSE